MIQSFSLIVPVALMVTLLSCWCVPRVITLMLASGTIGLGLITGAMDLIAIPPVLALGISGWWLAQQRSFWLWRAVAGLVFIVIAVALSYHWLPGFHNIQVWNNQPVKADSAPFTLFYNVDKPWIGLAILLFCTPLLKKTTDWQSALRAVVLPIVVMLPVVFGLGIVSGFVRWQPEWPQLALLFLLNNLLFTALAEEAFFRGFLQKSLLKCLSRYPWGSNAALLIAACVFGLAHFAGGTLYMALAAVAGAFYGWSYQRTGSLEMAILSHWLLNTCHFLFFTYPVAI